MSYYVFKISWVTSSSKGSRDTFIMLDLWARSTGRTFLCDLLHAQIRDCPCLTHSHISHCDACLPIPMRARC